FNQLPVTLVLPHRLNNITFEFAAIEPARPYMVRYDYKLDGYDKEWNRLTYRTSAEYGNMNERDYTFRVRAFSPDGTWSDEATFSFTVLSPWYRTWWAISLYSISLLVALYSIIKWRERKLTHEKEVLEDKVEVRTHELK